MAMLAGASSSTELSNSGLAHCEALSEVGVLPTETDFGMILQLRLGKIWADAELQARQLFEEQKAEFNEVIGKFQQQCRELTIENERLHTLLKPKRCSTLPVNSLDKETTLTNHLHSIDERPSKPKCGTILHLIRKFEQGNNKRTMQDIATKPNMDSATSVLTPRVASSTGDVDPQNRTSGDRSNGSNKNAQSGSMQFGDDGIDSDIAYQGGGSRTGARNVCGSRKVLPLPLGFGGCGSAGAHGDTRGITWTRVQSLPAPLHSKIGSKSKTLERYNQLSLKDSISSGDYNTESGKLWCHCRDKCIVVEHTVVDKGISCGDLHDTILNGDNDNENSQLQPNNTLRCCAGFQKISRAHSSNHDSFHNPSGGGNAVSRENVPPTMINGYGYDNASAHGHTKGFRWTKVPSLRLGVDSKLKSKSQILEWDNERSWRENTSCGDLEDSDSTTSEDSSTEYDQMRCKGILKGGPAQRQLDRHVLKALVYTAQQVVRKSFEYDNYTLWASGDTDSESSQFRGCDSYTPTFSI